MAPKKGLSFEEKRERLLDLFTETSEFFSLKELEKIAFKRKGIVLQSVKEVLQSLVDDDIVNTDKCGNQTVYWCLPSEASQKKKAKLLTLRDRVVEKEKQQEQLEAKVEQLGSGREATDEHGALLDAIAAKKARVAELDQELERFAEFDPDHVQKINESMRPVRDAANRWTDNLFCCQSWIVEKFSIERSEFSKQFEVPPDLDYLE